MDEVLAETLVAWLVAHPNEASAWDLTKKGRRHPGWTEALHWLRSRHQIDVDSLRQVQHLAKNYAWWQGLELLARRHLEVRIRSDGTATWRQRVRDLPHGLTNDLIFPFHPDLAGGGPYPPAESPDQPSILTDHHVHFGACVPASKLWQQVVGHLVPFGNRIEQTLATEATAVRWYLAERLLLLPRGTWTTPLWSEYCAQWSMPVAAAGVDVSFRPIISWFHLDMAPPRTAWDVDADAASHCAGLTGDQFEWELQRASVFALRDKNTPPGVIRSIGRYLQLGAWFRRQTTWTGNATGLALFTDAYHRRAKIESVILGATPTRGAERRRRRWTASIALRHLHDRGTRAADLRVPMGRDIAAVLEDIDQASEGIDVQLRYVAQLHRTKREPAVSACERLADLGRPKGLWALDLVGPERDNPPMPFESAYRKTQHLKSEGFRWFIHAAETWPHPLTGLRHLHWCLEGLGLGWGDRLGHALALSEERDSHAHTVPVNLLAMDLAWLATTCPDYHDYCKGWFSRLQPLLKGKYQHWNTWLSMGHVAAPALSQVAEHLSAGLQRVEPDDLYQEALQAARNIVLTSINHRGVFLECCPSSNRTVAGWDVLDMPVIKQPGLRWLLGTDDPALLDTDLASEGELLRKVDAHVLTRLVRDSSLAWQLEGPSLGDADPSPSNDWLGRGLPLLMILLVGSLCSICWLCCDPK